MSAKQELLNELRIERGHAPEPRRWPWLLLVLLVVVLGAAAGWWRWHGAAPLSVQVARAQGLEDAGAAAASDRGVLDATGYVTARRQATVSAEITGKVVEVLVEEGMHVEPGQLLARLDDQLLRASLELAQARLEEARSALEEVQVSLVEARANLARMRNLAREKLASGQALDEAQARTGVLEARLNSLRQSIHVADRNVEVQRQQMDDTLIRAPFAGVVIDKAAQPGEMISPVSAGGGFTRTGICTIVDMDSLEVEVDVSESYINRVRTGQPVEAVLNSYPDWRIPARVITIIPAADRNRATVRVRVELLERDQRVLPDMGVKVTFLDDAPATVDEPAGPDGVVVPVSAIFTQDNRYFVFVLDGDQAQRRSVQVGQRLGQGRVVSAGLRQGEQVITGVTTELAQHIDQGGRLQVASS